MARLRFARGLNGEQFTGNITNGPFRVRLGLRPTRAAQCVERRTSLARAHVFANQMRLGYRHVKFGRSLFGIASRIFNHETFLAGVRGRRIGIKVFSPRSDRQDL